MLGPEGPLIALGAGLSAWAARLLRRDMPAQAVAVVGATGSFAAVATLLGSPLLGAFLLMEASGLAGATASLVLVPGLLAAGIGALIFVGLDAATGLGSVSLAIPGLPPFARPDVAEFGWALVIGVMAALVGSGIRWLALTLRSWVERRVVLGTVLMGLVVAGLAIGYAQGTGKDPSDVLFSGQDALGPLVVNSADYSVGALLALVACKALAYGASLSCFRGGPVFPAMFIGAAGGIALSHLPGLPVVPARGDGDRRDVRRHAAVAVDLGAAGHPVAALGRARHHAAGHRGGRGRLRGVRLVRPGPAGGGDAGAAPTPADQPARRP